MELGQHTYFVSDLHLGLPLHDPRQRELKFVRFLDSIKSSAKTIYLMGDMFDFWWEYKKVVPRGFVRFLGKLAELTDAGIRVCFFTGNHDLWARDYLTKECGVEVFHQEQIVEIEHKTFFLAHGNYLGKMGFGEKLLKAIFTNKTLQFLYTALHPRIGLGFGHQWSKSSRLGKGISIPFKGENENLYKFATQISTETAVDYFVFGHRHTPVQMNLPTGAQMFILSDWITGNTYADFDGRELKLQQFEG